MSEGDFSDPDLREPWLREDDEPFPEPPPLPREREAAAQAREVVPPPPPPPPARPPESPANEHWLESPTPPPSPEPPPPEPPPAPTTRSAPEETPGAVGETASGANDLFLAPLPEPVLPTPTPPPPDKPRRPRHPSRRGGQIALFAGITLALFAIALAVVFFARRARAPEIEAPAVVAAGRMEPAGVDPSGGGRLLIDARPWGEVASIVDDAGIEVPLPAERQTPLVLSLEPGRYTVSVTHPDLLDEAPTCTVEVSASVGAICRVDILPVTSEEYWESVGWWR